MAGEIWLTMPRFMISSAISRPVHWHCWRPVRVDLGYIFEMYRQSGEKVTPAEGAQMLELRAESPFQRAVAAVMGRLGEFSRGQAHEAMPDWVTQTFEWDDGSLAELFENG